MPKPLAVRANSDSAYWSASLIACCLAAAVWAGFAPLSDPDLPMHLAVGEWIVAHRQVPFVEPFAWTRQGEPYYAYSWLAQAVLYSVMRAAGPVGLHLLAAVSAIAIVLAGAAAGSALGLARWRSVLLGCLTMGIAMESTPFLRPQLFMHALVPLGWALAIRLGDPSGGNPRWLFPMLWIVSALAAATHFMFLVLAAPIIVLFARATKDSSLRIAMAALAIVAGWLTSPYAMTWPRVFALNLGYNAITAGQSPAGELAPGFVVAPMIGAALAVLPMLVDLRSRGVAERIVLGLLWLMGLVVFARYFKGLSPWWWCALPLVVLALTRLPVLEPPYESSVEHHRSDRHSWLLTDEHSAVASHTPSGRRCSCPKASIDQGVRGGAGSALARNQRCDSRRHACTHDLQLRELSQVEAPIDQRVDRHPRSVPRLGCAAGRAKRRWRPAHWTVEVGDSRRSSSELSGG